MHFNEAEFKLARQETQIFTHRPPILLRDISIVFLLHHHRHHSPPPLTHYEALVGSLRYGDYGLRTTAGRVLSFVRSTGLSRANIER